jgi:hypothetical protein
MARFSKVFTLWVTIFLIFFALANLAGVVRPMGLVPFRFTGFPFTFMAWGVGVEEFFDIEYLLLNCLIGCTGSVLLAGALAWLRCRSALNRKRADITIHPIDDADRDQVASSDN